MIALVLALAAQAGPQGTLGASADLNVAQDETTGPGLGLGAGLWLGSRVDLELGLHGVLPPGAPALDLLGGVRLRLTTDRARPSLTAVARGGVRLDAAPEPTVGGGLGLDVPLTRRLGFRGEALVLSGQPSRVRVAFGVTLGVPAPPPPPEPPPIEVEVAVVDPPPVPEPDPSAIARVFVTHPVCEWTERPTLVDVARVLGDRPAMVRAPTSRPALLSEVVRPGFVDAEPVAQGSLVIVAHLGDDVIVGDRSLPLDRHGTVVATLGEVATTVTVTGGGRTEVHEAAIADGFALWLVAATPVPQPVQFELGSAVLSPTSAPMLADLAARRGGWSYLVQGGTSPEGTAAVNAVLGRDRAVVVRDALVTAGVPAEAVVVGDSLPPDPALTARQQRVAVVTPFPPESP